MISIRSISKTYHASNYPVQALDHIDLTIEPGEFTAIVGPSGSGKTTLLNLIGGLDQPTSGEVQINDTVISELSDNECIDYRLHHIGFVFQSYNLIPVLTAKENIEFLMLLQGRSESERSERVAHLLEAVGIAQQANKRPGEMSGGQQQRVAVARALASRPDLILADEPTANLDGTSTKALLDVMLKLNEDEGTTFIFSTHDHRVIERARRVITIEDGKVIDDTTKS